MLFCMLKISRNLKKGKIQMIKRMRIRILKIKERILKKKIKWKLTIMMKIILMKKKKKIMKKVKVKAKMPWEEK